MLRRGGACHEAPKAERRKYHRPCGRCQNLRTSGLCHHRRERHDHRHRYRCHGALFPEEPAAGPFYARCLVCGLQECRADGRELARQDQRGQFFPDRRGAFCRRGRRVGQPDGDQQENITDYRIGGLGQTLRIDRLVQSGRDDEFPVGIARRNQLRQLRYDPAAHKRTRRAVFAGTARQPPDLQFAGIGLRP